MAEYTHKELCLRGKRFLETKHRCVITGAEPKSTVVSEVPDAIGWKWDGECYLIEAKVTRSDFLSDKKKPHRAEGMADYRYYLTPKDLVKPEEVPIGWGLLYIEGRSIKVVKRPGKNLTRNAENEISLLVSMMRKELGHYDEPKYQKKRGY
jgi:hypothetical protein